MHPTSKGSGGKGRGGEGRVCLVLKLPLATRYIDFLIISLCQNMCLNKRLTSLYICRYENEPPTHARRMLAESWLAAETAACNRSGQVRLTAQINSVSTDRSSTHNASNPITTNYTLWHKKLHPFYFLDNSYVNPRSMLIIFWHTDT